MTLTTPAGGSVGRDAQLTFSGAAGTAPDDLPGVTVTVLDASGAPAQTLHTMSSAGAWSVRASAPLPDGTYTAQAQQADDAGNTGTSTANSFTVDTTPPDTTIISGSVGVQPSFTFTASEPDATFACRLDAAAWAPCSSPDRLGQLPAGSHTFAVQARDAAGNVDPTPATAAWAAGSSSRASVPRVTFLRLAPVAFRAGRSARPGAPRASRVRFVLSAPGTIVFRVVRHVAGVRRGAGCVALRAGGRRTPRCVRSVVVRTFRVTVGRGAGSLRFTGRLGGRVLAAGPYVLTARGQDATGRSGPPVSATFRILP